MNDEIKEINLSEMLFNRDERLLDCITNLQQINNNQAKRNSRQRLANQKQQDLILNLQQIEQEHKKINGELREENSKLEIALQNIQEDYDRRTKENERLKEKHDNSKSHQINYNYFKTLYEKATKDIVVDDLVYKCEDLDNLRQSYEKLYIEKEDYKSRCKKAIEYNKEIVDNYLEEDDCEYCDGRYATAKHNLNILQNGSDSQ